MADTKKKEKSAAGSLIEFVAIVAVALGLALGIQAFLVKPFRIPSESMVPTLDVGQRVLVDRVTLKFGTPDRGDIMVFKPPRGADDDRCGVEPRPEDTPCPRATEERSDTNFIKRVVAVGGDRLAIEDGHVVLNGKRQEESFIRGDAECATCNLNHEITIPKDHYYMMGDNRGASADSREWGPVPKKWLVGQAFITYWPPKKIGPL